MWQLFIQKYLALPLLKPLSTGDSPGKLQAAVVPLSPSWSASPIPPTCSSLLCKSRQHLVVGGKTVLYLQLHDELLPKMITAVNSVPATSWGSWAALVAAEQRMSMVSCPQPHVLFSSTSSSPARHWLPGPIPWVDVLPREQQAVLNDGERRSSSSWQLRHPKQGDHCCLFLSPCLCRSLQPPSPAAQPFSFLPLST